MDIIYVVVVLIVIGVVMYLIESFLPIDRVIKNLIHVVIVLFLILWLLNVFGITGHYVIGPRRA